MTQGEAGARQVLDILRDEFRRTMALAGNVSTVPVLAFTVMPMLLLSLCVALCVSCSRAHLMELKRRPGGPRTLVFSGFLAVTPG